MVGQFESVVAELLRQKKPHGQVILPCTLYDLAKVSSEEQIAAVYQEIDLCTTDGMPLVWWFRSRTHQSIERVYGPDILANVWQKVRNAKHTILCPNQIVFEELSKKFAPQLKKKTAQLILVGKSTDPKEKVRLAKLIKAFHPKFVWIGIGSPNQVLLGTFLRDTLRIPATYWCVGAAIPFLAGTVHQAPRWVQQNGLEWFFRLINEPRRLWRRYLVITPLFLFRLLFARIRSIRV